MVRRFADYGISYAEELKLVWRNTGADSVRVPTGGRRGMVAKACLETVAPLAYIEAGGPTAS